MIKIKIKSNKTGRIVEGETTPLELLNSDEFELVERLTECDCEPYGESSYKDCSCYEEWEDYTLDLSEV